MVRINPYFQLLHKSVTSKITITNATAVLMLIFSAADCSSI